MRLFYSHMRFISRDLSRGMRARTLEIYDQVFCAFWMRRVVCGRMFVQYDAGSDERQNASNDFGKSRECELWKSWRDAGDR